MNKLLFGLLILFSANSYATGGFGCSGEDKDLKFNFSATTGRMFGSPIANASGALEYKNMSGVRDIMMAEYAKENVVNYWNDSKGETKLALYFEGGTEDFFGEIQATLIFKRKRQMDGKSEGTLRVRKIINAASGPKTDVTHNLKVQCSEE